MLAVKSSLCSAAVLTILVLPGCALTDANVDVAYVPEAEKKSPLSTIETMAIAVVVEDDRDPGEKDIVGHKKNSYGMITAKIFSKTPPASVLHDALAKELAHNGHQVVGQQASPRAVVRTSLKRIWTEAKIHFWDVEVTGTLSSQISIVAPKSGQAAYTAPMSCTYRCSTQIVTDGDYQKALNGALAEFVRSFARDPGVLKGLRGLREPKP